MACFPLQPFALQDLLSLSGSVKLVLITYYMLLYNAEYHKGSKNLDCLIVMHCMSLLFLSKA
jgi:hypothetical protein